MARETTIGAAAPPPPAGRPAPADGPPDAALRPKYLRDVVGQRSVADRLQVAVNAAKKLGEPLGHILFDGPPGLGKTTFANVLPNELGTAFQQTSGPALSKPADLLPLLTNIAEGSILFIDEIHRMPKVVEEFIYPAMEDFRIDIVLGEGVSARTIRMPLKKFTLVGATTRSGMLSGPMRDRFRMHEHLEFYSVDELQTIVTGNARKLNLPLEADAAYELARRSRGTPRVANQRLHWVRSFHAGHEQYANGPVTGEVARRALDMQEVDIDGLDRQDRRYLETLIDVFGGGPTGVEAIAATMNLPADTLADEVEPYLLREQYVIRSPRGRMATQRGYRVAGRAHEYPTQPTLFSA